jgi:hypothetical protein
MGLGYSRELQAKDDVSKVTDRLHNERNKRAAVSSDTDGNQLAPVKKRRRVVKAAKKEEFRRNKEAIEDDLRQDKDEDSRKPPAVVKEEEDEPKDTEPPAAIKDEEGYGYETDENEEHEWEDSKKPPASIKEDVEDEVGSEYSPSESDEEGSEYLPGESDEESNWEQLATREENDDQATYLLPDEITSTKGLLPPARPSPAIKVTLQDYHVKHDEDEFGRDIKSTIAGASDTSDSVDGMVDQDDVILGVHHVKWNSMYRRLRAYKKSHGDCELFETVDRFAFILNTPANALPSLSPCIAGKVPSSYSLDPQLGRWVQKQRELFQNGTVAVERKAKLNKIGFEFSSQKKANEENWNLQFKKLQDYYGKHGHCELFWGADRCTFILEYLH